MSLGRMTFAALIAAVAVVLASPRAADAAFAIYKLDQANNGNLGTTGSNGWVTVTVYDSTGGTNIVDGHTLTSNELAIVFQTTQAGQGLKSTAFNLTTAVQPTNVSLSTVMLAGGTPWSLPLAKSTDPGNLTKEDGFGTYDYAAPDTNVNGTDEATKVTIIFTLASTSATISMFQKSPADASTGQTGQYFAAEFDPKGLFGSTATGYVGGHIQTGGGNNTNDLSVPAPSGLVLALSGLGLFGGAGFLRRRRAAEVVA